MEFKIKEQVIVKLFAGCKVDPGLRYQLDRSSKWKNAQFQAHQELVVIPYKGDEFIGTYINSIGISLEKLQLIEDEVRSKIKEYCPKYNDKQIQLQIFSQVFIK